MTCRHCGKFIYKREDSRMWRHIEDDNWSCDVYPEPYTHAAPALTLVKD